MNVGSIFELANRTGLWVFCGVRAKMTESRSFCTCSNGPMTAAGRGTGLKLESRLGSRSQHFLPHAFWSLSTRSGLVMLTVGFVGPDPTRTSMAEIGRTGPSFL